MIGGFLSRTYARSMDGEHEVAKDQHQGRVPEVRAFQPHEISTRSPRDLLVIALSSAHLSATRKDLRTTYTYHRSLRLPPKIPPPPNHLASRSFTTNIVSISTSVSNFHFPATDNEAQDAPTLVPVLGNLGHHAKLTDGEMLRLT